MTYDFLHGNCLFHSQKGVKKDATTKEIKRSFRKLAMKLHPDKNKAENAEAQFREIAEAYEVLSKEGTRKEYDRTGQPPAGNAGPNAGPSGNAHPGSRPGSNFDFNDFFKDFDSFFKGDKKGTGTK